MPAAVCIKLASATMSSRIHVSGDCTGFDSAILALRSLGLGDRVVSGFASDTNKHVRQFLRDNYNHTQIFHDIQRRSLGTLKAYLDKHGKIPTLYTAGWPCQPFSPQGKRLGIADERGTVGMTVARTIAALHPTSFMLENVPAVFTSASHRILTDVMLELIGGLKDGLPKLSSDSGEER